MDFNLIDYKKKECLCTEIIERHSLHGFGISYHSRIDGTTTSWLRDQIIR